MKNTYLKIGILSTLLFFSLSLSRSFAAAPQKLNYQTVVRNSAGVLISNANVGIKISILQGTSTGSVVYTETQLVSTNTNGLATLEIGAAAGFSSIDWFNGPFFIKTQIDPSGGSSYTITGTSPLLSVPYSLQAASLQIPNLSANTDDGKIGNSIFAPGLNIVGINNDNTTRKLQLWGSITQNQNDLGNIFSGNTSIAGRLSVNAGVIQNSGAVITTTADLGLYSRTAGNWLRIVANAAPIRFYTNESDGTNATGGAASMSIVGNTLGIGLNSPLSDLHIKQTGGSGTSQGTGGINLENAGYHWRIYNSNRYVRFNYSTDGVTYTPKAYVGDADGSWNQLSDERLKRDFESIENVLAKVLALKPLKYHYNDNKETAKKSMGFVAQEVEKLFPEIVSQEDGQTLLGIDYSKFAVVSIKAIQEQQTQLEALKKQVADLSSAVQKLSKK